MAESLYKDYNRVWENRYTKSALMESSLATYMTMAIMIFTLHRAKNTDEVQAELSMPQIMG